VYWISVRAPYLTYGIAIDFELGVGMWLFGVNQLLDGNRAHCVFSVSFLLFSVSLCA
jgi:hypothetical protein